jgi:hypothetical protein
MIDRSELEVMETGHLSTHSFLSIGQPTYLDVLLRRSTEQKDGEVRERE